VNHAFFLLTWDIFVQVTSERYKTLLVMSTMLPMILAISFACKNLYHICIILCRPDVSTDVQRARRGTGKAYSTWAQAGPVTSKNQWARSCTSADQTSFFFSPLNSQGGENPSQSSAAPWDSV
jgi:hypothetical protein